MVDALVFQIILETLRRVGSQENEFWLEKRARRVLRVVGSIELAHFVQDLEPVFLGHLEVEKHDADWPPQQSLGLVFQHLAHSVDRVLPIRAEGSLIGDFESRNLVLYHLEVNQLIFCYYDRLQVLKLGEVFAVSLLRDRVIACKS